MKVYLRPSRGLSRAMNRVAHALERYAPPDVDCLPQPKGADLHVHHVIGWGSLDQKPPTPAVIIQYCLRTTEDARPEKWLTVWRDAVLTWSYYDLYAYAGVDDFPFYRSPLGVDAEKFFPRAVPKRFQIATSGFVAASECVGEAADAVAAVDGVQFHLGPAILADRGARVHHAHGIPDATLAEYYSASLYTAGLRRGEGFELPAAEGLLCGARPVMFDAPHYKDWMGGWANYIEETDYTGVVEQLTAVFRGPYRAVTMAEIDAARVQFSWETIARGFWQAVRQQVVTA